jgi:hypothetical protein
MRWTPDRLPFGDMLASRVLSRLTAPLDFVSARTSSVVVLTTCDARYEGRDSCNVGCDSWNAGGATIGPTVLTNGDKPGVGIVAQEPTPRLAISQEPSGIPVLGLPPGVEGVVDIGADGDVGGPFDAKLHIPETPTVSIV